MCEVGTDMDGGRARLVPNSVWRAVEVAEVVGMAGPEEGKGDAVPALAEGAGGPPSRVPPIHRRAHDGGACWESSAVSAAAEAGTAGPEGDAAQAVAEGSVEPPVHSERRDHRSILAR